MAYIGRQQDGFGVRSRFIYTATGGQTTFTTDDSSNALSYSDGAYVDVYLNGVLLDPADYTATSLTSIVLGSGATASDILEVIVYDVFSVFSGTFTNGITANTATVTGDLTVDTDTLFVDSTNNEVGIGTTSPAGQLHIKGSDTTNQVIIENTDDDSGVAPDLTLRRTSASPADGDGIGEVIFQSLNDNSENLTMADMRGFVTDVSDGTEDGALTFRTRAAGSLGERMRIEGGEVGIGTTSPAGQLHISGDDVSNQVIIENTSADANNAPDLLLKRNSSTPADDDEVGQIVFQGRNDNSQFPTLATMKVIYKDVTDTTEDAALVYELMTGGTKSEVMRIEGGDLFVSKTSQNLDAVGVELRATGVTVLTADNGIPLFLNRQSTDGDMIRFYQAGNLEGSISVTGTTVELNGAHLTRWAQLSDGSKDTSILRGTVMTNLDQMAVWSHDAVAATYYVDGDELPEITPATYYTEDDTLPDGVSVGDEKTSAVYAKIGDEKTPAKDAYTEDNEQLNCVAVSSVEGDSNVAGVLSSWDNDDEQFNDMKIGMTGDMVIRIAQGTTVARGDLLMSAGDGTAKTQGDDIVRSKTIAKVTSTNVSHTYDDGSYLVPCVLMAC